jgi:hypothetical protein
MAHCSTLFYLLDIDCGSGKIAIAFFYYGRPWDLAVAASLGYCGL